jgi:glycosyltransferase involved in cell wall biosynthesis
MDISIIVPLLNEEGSLPELETWIRKVMMENNFSYEVLMVDDGSTDSSWQVIEALHQSNPNVKGVKFRRNYGKSAALNVGFEHAKGNVVITMDADLQDSPDEMPDLYKMIMTDGFDLVSGWKKERHDPISKTIPSKFFNAATRKMSGIELHDFNCGLKAYKNDVVKNIEVYGEMHRYIPLIAKWEGFKNIGEKVVIHQARIHGETKFGGWDRGVKGLLDLLSITFVGKFGKRPMHLFGTLGAILFLLGTVILLVLSYNKLILDEYDIANRPLFFLGILFFIIGTQLFLAGFLAEMIARVNPKRNNYQVEKVLEK